MPPKSSSSKSSPVPTVFTGKPQQAREGEGKITEWLKRHGIPVHAERQGKLSKRGDGSETKSHITASNVSTSELTKYLGWEFVTSVTSDLRLNPKNAAIVSAALISCQSIFEELKKITNFSNQEQPENPLFLLPSEWRNTDRQDYSNSDVSSQNTFMNIIQSNPSTYNLVGFSQNASDGSHIPNVSLMYDTKLLEGGISRSLLNILILPAFNSKRAPDTEQQVEHFVGGALSGFFNIADCKTTSNGEIKFHKELACFGSNSKPDYGVRIQENILNVNDHSLCPLVQIAEAKKRLEIEQMLESLSLDRSRLMPLPDSSAQKNELQVSEQEAPKSRISAQMAFSAYPSLVIFISSLINQWKNKKLQVGKVGGRARYQVPTSAVIYGIGYGANGVIIYAYFPYVSRWDATDFPQEWKFMSAMVTTVFWNVFATDNNFSQRLRLIAVLLRLQDHATKLKDAMKSATLPDVFFEKVQA